MGGLKPSLVCTRKQGACSNNKTTGMPDVAPVSRHAESSVVWKAILYINAIIVGPSGRKGGGKFVSVVAGAAEGGRGGVGGGRETKLGPTIISRE